MNDIKFNFAVNCSNAELNKLRLLNPDKHQELFLTYHMVWSLQTYLRLSKNNTLEVFCSNTLRSDCINIITSEMLIKLKNISSYFIVCIRIDHHKRIWAHHHIVQNKNQTNFNSSYIPHWPQPGQINRDPARKTVKTVAYVGYAHNGNLASTPETWKKMLEPYSLQFIFQSEKSWFDLSNVDVLVGIRSFDKKPHDNKPPSKLINAWHAGIPFIGGHDSAFKQIGTPGKDYLLVETQQEALSAILRLQNEPELYSKLQINGWQKANDYTIAKIIEIWKNTLTGPVLKRYRKWQSRKRFEIIRFSILSKIGKLQIFIHQFFKKINTKQPIL